jgi:glycosyltransferase involved in cell wall biosynthesis
MRVGIDASNLREGGGVTHLVELVTATAPAEHGIREVVVWAGRSTLAHLPSRPWLRLRSHAALDGSLPRRTWWQARVLQHEAASMCDVLFVPGGSYYGAFRPVVTMCRNMLTFDAQERARYGATPMRVKLEILRHIHRTTFRRAAGLIFLTEHARDVVAQQVDLRRVRTRIIPHGVDAALFMPPRPAHPITSYSHSRPFRMLYVSKVEPYKHQSQVVAAVTRLRREGIPIELRLVGGANPSALRRLRAVMALSPDVAQFIRYDGELTREALRMGYGEADAFVFASTCENLPNILLEAMAAGLPIASSNRPPMPAVLGPEGVYFDPESPASIGDALHALVRDPGARLRAGAAAYARARMHSWERCARETFAFIRSVAAGASASGSRVVEHA